MDWLALALLLHGACLGAGVAWPPLRRLLLSALPDGADPAARLLMAACVLLSAGQALLSTLTLAIGVLVLPPGWMVSLIALLLAGFLVYTTVLLRAPLLASLRSLDAWDAAGFLLAGSPLVLLLWMTFSPELEIDSIVYHLSVPAAWLNEGAIVRFPYEPHSNWHFLSQMTYLWALAIEPGGVIVAKLMELGRCVGAAIGVAGLGRWLQGRALGYTAAFLVLASEDVGRYGVTAHVDAGGMLYAVAGAIALAGATENGSRKSLVLAGLLLGCLAAVKQTGAALLLPAWLAYPVACIVVRREEWRPVFARTILLGVAMAPPSVPWWLKNTVYTGSPFFPFLVDVFPPFDDVRVGMTFFARYYAYGEGGPGGSALTIDHLYVLNSNAKLSSVTGILFLGPGALLGWLLLRRTDPAQGGFRLLLSLWLCLAVVPLVFAPFWRFLYPLYPIAVLAAGNELVRITARSGMPWMATLLLAGAVTHGARNAYDFALYRQFGRKAIATPPVAPVLTSAQAGEWYAAHAPTATTIDWINGTLGPEDRLLASRAIPTLPLLRVRCTPNAPCIAREVITTLEETGHSAAEMAAVFHHRGWTHVYTLEPLDGGEAARFRETYLEEIRRDPLGGRVFRFQSGEK